MIYFNDPYRTQKSISHVGTLAETGKLSGDGDYARLCCDILRSLTASEEVLLTPSATSALELMILASGLKRGDEVIVPSYTFSSTVNAICLFGCIPVFADINPQTMNINEHLLEALITPKTKAIMTVNYGGGSPDYTIIADICKRHNILLLEDAAQSIGASFNGRMLGTFGAMACLSFHETKNVQCGEGGAVIVNDKSFLDRVKIIREKGTNRHEFVAGKIDKYSWKELGSSYLMNEITAAYLLGQLEEADQIFKQRLYNAHELNDYLETIVDENISVPSFTRQNGYNGHISGLLFKNNERAKSFQAGMLDCGVQCTTHYTALHNSAPGRKFGVKRGSLSFTEKIAETFIRLPIHSKAMDLEYLIKSVASNV